MKKLVIWVCIVILAFVFVVCESSVEADKSLTKNFTVTFNLNGGNIDGNTSPVIITVKSRDVIANLPVPEKTDYIFGGWFSAKFGKGNEFTPSTAITSDMIVYAKWTPTIPIKDIISFENYPVVDGSTSTYSFSQLIACKFLDIPYIWTTPYPPTTEWALHPTGGLPEQHRYFFRDHVLRSQTHGAFLNLIDGNADIIFNHRTMSPDERAYADAVGVTLIETTIALDAFDFIVSKYNPVKALTVNQIQKIYTREITNWSELGGKNADIRVYTRPRNSGSEEVFRTLVMNGLEPANFPCIYFLNLINRQRFHKIILIDNKIKSIQCDGGFN
jgi:uncharacterized repeat protein (TIGR02543 family)